MGSPLEAAAKEGDINRLYTEIKQNPSVLEHIESMPFVETPLHIAASNGHIHFAHELMILKPSFALKLNQQGLTPIHLAVEHDHEELVYRLVDLNKELVRVKGKGDLTPLHLASEKGRVELLKTFLEVCPGSIADMTIRSETALHIAARSGHHEALEVLVRALSNGSFRFRNTILNWKDDDDNTILHIAALKNNKEAVALLIQSKIVNLEAKNLEGRTALNIIISSADMWRTLAEAIEARKVWKPTLKTTMRWSQENQRMFTRRELEDHKDEVSRVRRHVSGDELNVYLVVVGLIATASYQAALSPPGGLSNQTDVGTHNSLGRVASHTSINLKSNVGNEGNSIMPTLDFLLFFYWNIACFMHSTLLLHTLLPKNKVMGLELRAPLLSFQLSFLFGLLVISPNRSTTIVLVVISSLFYFMLSVIGNATIIKYISN